MSQDYKPIKFPSDESVHNHTIEWWYFNGNLKDKSGNRFAFMNCLFRADTKKVNIPFLSKIPVKVIHFYHAIISDVENRKCYPSVDDLSVVSEDSFTKPLLFINHVTPLVIGGYTNRVIEQSAPGTYCLKDENIDLVMKAAKRPLLEGGKGYVDVNSKKSYYYSLTNLQAVGRIRIKNRWIDVTGKAWMDHQWANTKYTKDKWTWFSIQLDDDREMVCYEYDDGQVKTYLASISHADGRDEHFDSIDIRPVGDEWVSPKTKAVYPLTWQLAIPEKQIDLLVRPLIKDQEVVFGSINYWEGPLEVTGNFEGEQVSGNGFMELVGRPSKYNNIQYAQDKLLEAAGGIFSYTKKNLTKKIAGRRK